MDRRSLLKALMGGGVAALVLPIPTKIETRNRFQYKQYQLIWTGWKWSQNSTLIVGQWLAYPKREDWRPIYSSYPGECDFYRRGDVFNLTISMNQPLAFLEVVEWKTGRSITVHELEELDIMKAARQQTLDRLQHFIDEHPDNYTAK